MSMSISENLRLLITADTAGAVRSIQQVGRTADRELSRSQQTMDKWGNKLTTIGAGMVALGAVGVAGMAKAAMASEEANLAVVKLENTLANMPKLAGENSQQFIDLADSIQDVTAADADAIVEAEALLGTFNLTAREIQNITPLVVDYARKFGVDVPSAAIQVGKALDGQIGALKRNGVSIDEVLFKTDRYAAVQQALTDQVGGFAKAEGETFAGSLQRLKNEMGDLAEGVGVGAVDAFESMFGVVEGVTDRFNELSPATQSLIGQIATFGSVGLIAAGGLSIIIGQTLKAAENFKAAGEAVRAFGGRIGGLSGLATGLSIVGPLTVGAAIAMKAYSDTKAEATRITDRYVDALKEEADATVEATDAVSAAELTAGDLGSKLRDLDADLELFNSAIRGSGDEIEELDNKLDVIREIGFDEALDKGVISASDLTDELSRLSGEMSRGEIVDLIDRLDGLSDRYDDARQATQNANFAEAELQAQHGESVGTIDELTDGMSDQAGATDEARTAIQEYNDTLHATLDPIFGMIEAQTGVRDAQLAAQEAQAALNEAIKEHGPNSAEAAEAQRDLTDAQIAAGEAALDLDGAIADLTAAVENGEVSVDDARDALDRWVAQGLITEEQAGVLAFAFGVAGAQADAAAGDYPLTISGSEDVTPMVDRINRKMAELHDKDLTIRTHFVSTGQGGSGGIPFHEGGVVPGRRGEEVAAILQAGERVISLAEMDNLRRGGSIGGGGPGTGTVINVTVNVDRPFGSPSEIGGRVVEAIRAFERGNGPGWRN